MRPVFNALFPVLIILAASGSARRAPAAAPEFNLPTASANVSLQQLRGKVVYVDFWASWCVPCRESFPWMASMSEKYRSQGLTVVAINLDKNRDAADAFLEKFTSPFTVAFDPAGRTAERFNVQAMPSSFLISRDGVIAWTHEGFEPSQSKDIEERIQEELSR